MIKDLNRMGLTTVGSAGCETDLLPAYQRWADQGQLNLRVFCIDGVGTGITPEQVGHALPQIGQMKLFQGNNYLDHIFFGESVYGPLHDPMFLVKSDPKPDQLVLWRRIATEVAKARLPLHVHAELEDTIGSFLDRTDWGESVRKRVDAERAELEQEYSRPAERDAFMAAQTANVRAALLKKYPAADTNGDGVLSEEEMLAFARTNGGMKLHETTNLRPCRR